MLFKYKGLDKNALKYSGNIDAKDRDEALIRLRQRGIFAEKITPITPSILDNINLRKTQKIPPSVLANLSRDISIYIDAGISIVGAIRLASIQYKQNKKLTAMFSSIMSFLDEGKSFANALESQKIYAVPAFFIQSVKISENGGMLSEVLSQMSSFIKTNEKTLKQVRSHMFYPSFILLVAIVMIAFMIVFIVPKITGLFEEMGQELPAITQFVISLSDFLSDYYFTILLFIIAVVTIFSALIKFNASFAFGVDLAKLKIPLFGRIIFVGELARFSYMMSVLLRSGVGFVQGISMCASTMNNKVLKEAFNNASQRVIEGAKFSSAILQSKVEIDEAFVQAIALGEETSELEKILSNLSLIYFEDNQDKIAIFLSLLEPALMLFVGLTVGFIVVSMLLPIFSMNIG